MTKTIAAIIHDGGWLVGLCRTALRGGEACHYGHWLPGGHFHRLGSGKISRAKRWLTPENEADAEIFDVRGTRGGS